MVYSFLQQLYIMEKLSGSAKEEYYQDLLAYIQKQGLSPLVCQLLYTSGQQERTPLFFREQLQLERKEALFRNLLLKKESSVLFNSFEAAGVEAIPIKGTLFAETYLGHLSARYTSDIDILVQPKDVDAAVAIVHALGYDQEDPINPDHFHRVFYKQRMPGRLPAMIEIHWNLIKSSSSHLNTENLWSEAHCLHPYTYIKQLSLRHTFYTICLHGTNHSMDSTKHVLDIAHLLFTRGKDLDYAALFEQAKNDSTLNRVYESLAIVYDLLPALHTVKPLAFPSKHRRIASWNNRIIRRSASEPEGLVYALHSFLFSWRTADSWKYRRALLRNLILPSPSLALYSVNDKQKPSGNALTYLKLYRQRLGKLLPPLSKWIGERK